MMRNPWSVHVIRQRYSSSVSEQNYLGHVTTVPFLAEVDRIVRRGPQLRLSPITQRPGQANEDICYPILDPHRPRCHRARRIATLSRHALLPYRRDRAIILFGLTHPTVLHAAASITRRAWGSVALPRRPGRRSASRGYSGRSLIRKSHAISTAAAPNSTSRAAASIARSAWYHRRPCSARRRTHARTPH